MSTLLTSLPVPKTWMHMLLLHTLLDVSGMRVTLGVSGMDETDFDLGALAELAAAG